MRSFIPGQGQRVGRCPKLQGSSSPDSRYMSEDNNDYFITGSDQRGSCRGPEGGASEVRADRMPGGLVLI